MGFQEKDGNPGAMVLDAELLGTSLPGLEQICAEMLQEEGYVFPRCVFVMRSFIWLLLGWYYRFKACLNN